MIKLTDSQKRMIVLTIGIIIVLFGLIQAIFKNQFFIKYEKVIYNVTYVLMLSAAALLFSIKRKPKKEPDDTQNQITKQAEPEEKENQPE